MVEIKEFGPFKNDPNAKTSIDTLRKCATNSPKQHASDHVRVASPPPQRDYRQDFWNMEREIDALKASHSNLVHRLRKASWLELLFGLDEIIGGR